MNKIFALCAILGASAALSGCGEPTPEELASRTRLYAMSYGQMAVEQSLRDPGSVEWEWKAVNLNNGALCYIYRARNGFGGMAQGYAVIYNGDTYHNMSKTFGKYCQDKGVEYEVY